MELQKLTISNYGPTPEENRRLTLAPHKIVLIAAKHEDCTLNGRVLREVAVMFDDGASIDLVINHSDLELLEAATGSFCLG